MWGRHRGHLISGELDDWIPRTQRILEHGTAKAFDPFDRFAHVGRDVDTPLDALIDRFAELRTANLAKIDTMATDDNLDLRGLHPLLGEVTLRELLATWAVHDLDHVSQIYAGLAGSYDAEVWPWKAYLGILLRRDDPAAVPGEPDSPFLEAEAQTAMEAGRSRCLSILGRPVLDPVRGPSRWFITDEEQHDEFGLARTVGPFDTLDAAKAAADALRDEAPAASPLAGRLAKDGEPSRTSKRGKEKPQATESKPPPPPPRDLVRQARGRLPRGRASRAPADRRARGRRN